MRCTHGATSSGRWTRSSFFYSWRAGSPSPTPQQLIIAGFEPVRAISVELLRALVTEAMDPEGGALTWSAEERCGDDGGAQGGGMTTAPERRLDAAAIRRDFPILEREIYGKRLAYLDNTATTRSRSRLHALDEFYRPTTRTCTAASTAWPRSRRRSTSRPAPRSPAS